MGPPYGCYEEHNGIVLYTVMSRTSLKMEMRIIYRIQHIMYWRSFFATADRAMFTMVKYLSFNNLGY